MILIGSQGKVLHLNRRAHQIVSAHDGLRLDKHLGNLVLTAGKSSETRALHGAIALALRPDTIEYRISRAECALRVLPA